MRWAWVSDPARTVDRRSPGSTYGCEPADLQRASPSRTRKPTVRPAWLGRRPATARSHALGLPLNRAGRGSPTPPEPSTAGLPEARMADLQRASPSRTRRPTVRPAWLGRRPATARSHALGLPLNALGVGLRPRPNRRPQVSRKHVWLRAS